MSSDGQSSGLRTVAITALVIPALILAFLFGIVLISDTTSQAACGPTGTALTVDPASVPEGPIAGYDHEQLVNAAHIMLAAQKLGLSARDQQIGVSTAMGESSLRVLDYGDDVGPDSRGLFQQRDNGAWGSYSDRMDPFISATNFFRVEMTIAGRESMEPTLVSNAVQRNADPYHYTRFWEPAGAVVSALGGVQQAADPGRRRGSGRIGVQPRARARPDRDRRQHGWTHVRLRHHRGLPRIRPRPQRAPQRPRAGLHDQRHSQRQNGR